MKLIGILIFFIATAAFASSAGEGHTEGVPRVVFWQFVNLVILFGIVYYYFGQKIKDAFKAREASFLSDFEKSKSIQQEAEKRLLDIKHKIRNLEDNEAATLARAQAEAADMRNQLILEAKQFVSKIKREAESAAQIEMQNAKRELHDEVVKAAVFQAHEILKKDVGQADQQRLQEQFSKQIEGVQL